MVDRGRARGKEDVQDADEIRRLRARRARQRPVSVFAATGIVRAPLSRAPRASPILSDEERRGGQGGGDKAVARGSRAPGRGGPMGGRGCPAQRADGGGTTTPKSK